MRTCQVCGTANDDAADFCVKCGNYLRWEMTGAQPTVEPASSAAAAPVESQPDAGGEGRPDAGAAGEGEPGVGATGEGRDRAGAAGEGEHGAGGPGEGWAQPGATADSHPEPRPAAVWDEYRTVGGHPPRRARGDEAVAPSSPPGPSPARAPSPSASPPHAPRPAADGEPAAPPEQAPLAPDSVVVSLRHPEDEGGAAGPLAGEVEPGGRTTLVALVRNQSTVVDNYDLRVEGLPEQWWTAAPATVYLVPYGERGTYEQEVEVQVHPPRAPEAEARAWPIEVVAASSAYERDAARAAASITIRPFYEFELALDPERASGRRAAGYDVAVRNRGNAALSADLSGADNENACRLSFEPERVTTQAGGDGQAALEVAPIKPIWIGRRQSRPLAVTAQAVEAGELKLERRAEYVQKPWFPWWTPLAVIALIAAAVFLWSLIPRTEVPDLSSARNVFDAQKRLTDAGLTLGKVSTAESKRPPGTILDQDPDPGRRVDDGAAVSLETAVGPERLKVPKVENLSLDAAESRLDKRGFQLGKVDPEPDDPKQAKVVKQVPAAGSLRREGAPVNLRVTLPASGEQGDEEGREGKNGGGAPGPVPRGSNDDGTKPGPADVRTEIAYDDGRTIVLIAGATGKRRPALKLQGGATQEQPTWTPDGRRLVFRGGDDERGRIFVVDPKRPAGARALTTGGHDDRRPAVSPDGEVVAFVRGDDREANHDLCFVSLVARGAEPDCLPDPKQDVSGPTWSPDGESILARAGDAESIEVVQYTSELPSSGRASDWRLVSSPTEGAHATRPRSNLGSVAWSPARKGSRVALTANWDSGEDESQFRVYLLDVGAGNELGKPELTSLSACDVAWRPDGRELALGQQQSCGEGQLGRILRVDPDKPNEQQQLAPTAARNPAWRPRGDG